MSVDYNIGFEEGYQKAIQDFGKFIIDKSENGIISVINIPDYVAEMRENMHPQTKAERERLNGVIHDFCRGDTMLGKGCLNCILNDLNVCGDGIGSGQVPMSRLRQAERIINEVMTNDT